MAWVLEELFHVDGRIVKEHIGLTAGQGNGLCQVLVATNHAHTATTTATGGLDDDRVANLVS